MTASYPSAQPTFITPGAKLGTAAHLHSSMHTQHNEELAALLLKAGISESSPADAPLANTVLQSLTNGKSKWATIIAAMIASDAVTTAKILDANVTTAKIADAAVTNAKANFTWSTWTPQVWQNGQRTITISEARYLIVGKLVHALMTVTVTNAGTTNNPVQVVVPATPGSGALAAVGKVVGTMIIVRTGVTTRIGAALMGTVNVITGIADGKADAFGTASDAFALANGDIVSLDIMYELA